MIIKPDSVGNWYSISKARNPDKDEECWKRGWGEFSVSQEERFEKHLKRYNILNKYFAKLNGKRIKATLREEPLFFGIRGMEQLVYHK